MVVKQQLKDWITKKLDELKTYDARRPENHPYNFYEHSHRVANNMKLLALAMDMGDTKADALYWATLVHDIGKTALPIEIWDYDEKNAEGKFLKPPEKLKKQRRKHTTLGAEMAHEEFGNQCDTDPFLQMLCDLMQNHHEHLDGSGYLGKKQADLSPEVQMLCICDAYDGWTVARPHKPARLLDMDYVINHKMSDGRFNKKILKKFKEIIKCQSTSYSCSPSSY